MDVDWLAEGCVEFGCRAIVCGCRQAFVKKSRAGTRCRSMVGLWLDLVCLCLLRTMCYENVDENSKSGAVSHTGISASAKAV